MSTFPSNWGEIFHCPKRVHNKEVQLFLHNLFLRIDKRVVNSKLANKEKHNPSQLSILQYVNMEKFNERNNLEKGNSRLQIIAKYSFLLQSPGWSMFKLCIYRLLSYMSTSLTISAFTLSLCCSYVLHVVAAPPRCSRES